MSNTPPPLNASIIELDPRTGKPLTSWTGSKQFWIWIQNALLGPVSTSVQIFPAVTLSAQNASIGTTPIPLPSLPTGTYRLTYYARITTAGTVSSSLTVNFFWTESGQAMSAAGAAITGNTVTTFGSQSIMILSDAASALSYSTTYASNAAGEMKYRLTIKVEAL